MQTAVGVDREVASAPTLCRLEKWADCATAWRLHQVLVDQFIASFKTVPEELVLDFDATDNPLHGHQEGRFFHGYYDSYCYLPLYVFCGQQLLCAYLRPSCIDGARHAAAILELLARRLREHGPTCASSCEATRAFAAGESSTGASARACTTSSARRATRAWRRRSSTRNWR